MWPKTNELKTTRDKLIRQSRYALFLMVFDYVSVAIDLKKEQYGLRNRLHTTILRYESKKKYLKVLNKLFEEALDYVAVHKDEFEDPMDRQLIDFMKTYIYHKKNRSMDQ